MLLTVIAFVGLGGTKNILEIPLQTETNRQPILPVTVGSSFEFKGIYKTGHSSDGIQARVVLSDGGENRPLILQLRINFDKGPLEGNFNYFFVSSVYENIYASAAALDYEKRYLFPMDLVDGLEIKILLEITQNNYDVTINGVKSTESMINSRDNVEYFKSKTLTIRSSDNFIFKTAVQMVKIGESSLHLSEHHEN